MKRSISQTLCLAVAAVSCSAGLLFAPNTAQAQAPAAVNDAAKLTSSVTVPSDGEAVTYKDKSGKTVTIKPGETATIPGDARQIKLPANTSLTITRLSTPPSTYTYKVNAEVVLNTLSTESLEAASGSLALLSSTGSIKLPSATMIDLMTEVRRLSENGINPFALKSGSAVSDGF